MPRNRLGKTIFNMILGITMAFGASLGHARTKTKAPIRGTSKIIGKTLPKTLPAIAWNQLETPVEQLKNQSKNLSANNALRNEQPLSILEGIANRAILARIIKSVYLQATAAGWSQTESFRIFPLEHLLSNSAMTVPTTFNPDGFRVAVFALRSGTKRNGKFLQRGVLLTSSFQSLQPGELRELYRENKLPAMLEGAAQEFDAFGATVLKRFNDVDTRQSQYPSVNGNSLAWIAGCQMSIAGRFCVSASLFDSEETDPTVFVDALSAPHAPDEFVQQVRAQNLAWPVEKTYIVRGFNPRQKGQHLGLDMTAPIGTPVYAVADGMVRYPVGEPGKRERTFSGWGTAVVLEHVLPNGTKYISLYAHLSKFQKGLKAGDVVRRGQLIAFTGKSGLNAKTGEKIAPHLHLEIRKIVEGKEPLMKPNTPADFPIDPLRVLDIFNVFIGNEGPSV